MPYLDTTLKNLRVLISGWIVVQLGNPFGQIGLEIVHRSAGLQPAVSQVCNLLALRISGSADCKSAIQQVANLRYKERGCVGSLAAP